MASFSVIDITSTSATIQIEPDSDYLYYRVFVRLADDTSDSTFDEVYEVSSADTVLVSGLSPQTDYVVNVGYNNTGVAHVEGWIGADSFTTESEEPSNGDGVVKIYVNGEWVNAIPYIYTETGWVQAIPYIYADGWKATQGS